MKRLSFVCTLLVVIAGCALFESDDDGWSTLIDGTKGMENWSRVGDANWRAEDGAIVAD